MEKSKKALILALSFVLIFSAVTATTYSWLSSQSETVMNTFAGGAITVTIDEAQVDPHGKKIPNGERVISNNYKYVAGSVLDKDPTPTILKGSDECYVFLCVENELPDMFTTNTDEISWTKVTKKDNKTLYMYFETVDAENAEDDIVLNPIFTQVTVSKELTQDDIAQFGEKALNVTAYAIQTEALTPDEAIQIATEQFFTK